MPLNISNTANHVRAALVSAFIAIGLTSCTKTPTPLGPSSLQVQWNTPNFKDPESVLLSADASFLYVSNIDGQGHIRDGNGYISKLGKDGVIITEKWAIGIDAPKGMALKDDKLYVSDIDKLIEIDTGTGKILQSIPAAGSKFLNDVAYVAGLGILVSDSSTKSIYLYDGKTMEVWLKDDLLGGINGLHTDGNRVLIVTMSAGQLLSLDTKTKTLSVIASGIENADGIKILPDNSYIASSWPGQIYHITEAGKTTLLQDTSAEEILMNDFELEGNIVYMANLKPGTVQAIKVSQ